MITKSLLTHFPCHTPQIIPTPEATRLLVLSEMVEPVFMLGVIWLQASELLFMPLAMESSLIITIFTQVHMQWKCNTLISLCVTVRFLAWLME
jgi:hypothetical protein